MFAGSFDHRGSCVLFLGLALSAAVGSVSVSRGEDKDAPNKETKVAGIVIDRKDNWLTLKVDGEEEITKYVAGPQSDKRLLEALNMIFNAGRVQLTYKQDGDTRQLVSIKRQIFKETGTVTGNVVKVYGKFWVEVKPKTGLADAYAPGANYNDKAFMEKLNSLQPGDTVTIKFYTDFERHRIESLTINKRTGAAPQGDSSLQTGPPAKK